MSELQEIPINFQEPHLKLRVILDNIQVVMQIDWNDEDSRWQISISDANENPLVMGLAMNINEELIQRFSITGLPLGQLVFLNTTGKDDEAGIDDLGNKCRLFYQTLN